MEEAVQAGRSFAEIKIVVQPQASSPLRQMNTEERLSADYSGTGLTVGQHPLHYRRKELQAMKVLTSS